mgnify:CR=1 FL=1
MLIEVDRAQAAQGGVLEKARMQGAGRQFDDGGRAGDGDGVGALGLHRRTGDGDIHQNLGSEGQALLRRANGELTTTPVDSS